MIQENRCNEICLVSSVVSEATNFIGPLQTNLHMMEV